jgi:hypothetical protein
MPEEMEKAIREMPCGGDAAYRQGRAKTVSSLAELRR